MDYIIEFDIAALFINAIVIFFYNHKKNIATMQNRMFFLILCTLSVSTVLDVVETIQIQYAIAMPGIVLWILNCLSYTTTNFFGLLFAMYCISLIEYNTVKTNRHFKLTSSLLIIPFVFIILEIWLSPFFYYVLEYPLVFYIDAAGVYHRGNTLFFYSLYLFCAYYVIFSFILLIRYRSKIKIRYIFLLFLYISSVLVAVTIQLFNPNLLVLCFGFSIASLVFFFYIQRPEEVLNCGTDCFNQNAFARIITQQIAECESVTCISIILDDTFFLSNTFGISRLDDFMRGVADYLKNNFSTRNIYQLNQGCFCVVLKNADKSEIQNTIGKLQSRFNKVWDYGSIHIKLYSRLCVIACPDDAETAEEILDIVNMVTSDERYKQSVVFSGDIDLEYKRRTLFIDHAVRLGLSENRMEVYYQPIYSTEKKRLIGAEALIRLRDDDDNFISPEDFIPIAEKNGSILRIGEFVFESVCRTLSAIDCKFYGIEKIDINLSVAQCMQEILAEQILTIRSMYNVPASLINLEITETAAAHTPEILLQNMQNLSNAGFELSLDDYGSGYSNMNYMLNLPFKMIKIDKYIVWSAFEDKRANTALTATIQMIKQLNMTVLAEGVETKEQADWLSKLGCDYLQGFYYSKPVPREEYLKKMNEDKKRYLELNPDAIEEFETIEDIEIIELEEEPDDNKSTKK